MTIRNQYPIVVENKEMYIPLTLPKELNMIGCEPYTPEKEKELLEYFSKRRYSERNVALLTFGIQTGFRISEILSLRRRDLVQNGNIVDKVYMKRKNMKGGKSEKASGTHGRAMLIMPPTQKVLKVQVGWLDDNGYTEPDDYFFQTQRAGNCHIDKNGFWRQLREAKIALGWTGKFGTHSMRKTFAARIYADLIDKGNADALRILQAGLGHENINNTIKYLSFKEDDLIEAMQSVFGGIDKGQ